MYVGLSNTITVENLGVKSLFFWSAGTSPEDVKFLYEGHPVKIKVTASENREVPPAPFPECKTSIGSNSRAVKFACSVGF